MEAGDFLGYKFHLPCLNDYSNSEQETDHIYFCLHLNIIPQVIKSLQIRSYRTTYNTHSTTHSKYISMIMGLGMFVIAVVVPM